MHKQLSLIQTMIGAMALNMIISLSVYSHGEQVKVDVDSWVQNFLLGQTVYPQEMSLLQWGLGLQLTPSSKNTQFSFPASLNIGTSVNGQIDVAVPLLVTVSPKGSSVQLDSMLLSYLYTFYNSARTGWAFAAGGLVGFPSLFGPYGNKSFVIEPYGVAYKDFGWMAANLTASLGLSKSIDGSRPFYVDGTGILSLLLTTNFSIIPVLEVLIGSQNNQFLAQIGPQVNVNFSPLYSLTMGAIIGLTPQTSSLASAVIGFNGNFSL